MGLVVECVGIPGAGKSHLTREIHAELGVRGLQCMMPGERIGPVVPRGRRVLRRVSLAGCEMVRSPRAVAEGARATLGSSQDTARDLLARGLAWPTLRGLTRGARGRRGISIFDQGSLTELWSTGFPHGEIAPWRALLAGDSWQQVLPDAVIWVETDVPTAVARLSRRTTRESRVELLPEAEMVVALHDARRDLASIVDWWESASVRSVVRLTVSGSQQNGHGVGPLVDDLLAACSFDSEDVHVRSPVPKSPGIVVPD